MQMKLKKLTASDTRPIVPEDILQVTENNTDRKSVV